MKMAEQTFFDEAGVTVTNARFIASGRTFAVNGITSVSLYNITPRRTGPIAFFVIAFLILIGGSGGSGSIIGALVLAGIGVLYWLSEPVRYSVRLMTASGESDAFTARDEFLIERIVRAVNDAIVARG
jgi:hypothetical protein